MTIDDDENCNVCDTQSIHIRGIIVRRRSMGKNLAFAHVKVNEGMTITTTTTMDGKNNDDEEHIIQVVFRRQSPAWDDVSQENRFPTKNSQLPYGALIQLRLSQQGQDQNNSLSVVQAPQPKYEVCAWSVLVDPRTEAIEQAKTKSKSDPYAESESDNDSNMSVCGPGLYEGVSCSKYFESRMNQYLKYNSNSGQKGQHQRHNSKMYKEMVGRSSTNNHRNNASTDAANNVQDTHLVQDDSQSESPHGNKKHKALRAKIFASFLIETFGSDFFRNGNILDVAGGKGQLSLELSLQSPSQLQCTIIDPLIRGKKETQHFHSRDIKRIHKANGLVPHHIAKCFFWTKNEDYCLDLVRKATCIVGLHPDECTEDILDAALEMNKAAAIIPCCVFASLFPDRRLKSGAAVCSYDEFLAYLMEKDERIRRFSLPFQGKNQVLIFDPRPSA